jgi:hypothetical protein
MEITAIIAMPWSFHGILIGDCMRSECASTAFFVLSLRFYGDRAAVS